MKGSLHKRVNAAMNPLSIVVGCSRRQKISLCFNLQRQTLLIYLINNSVIESQNKIALKYIVILYLV